MKLFWSHRLEDLAERLYEDVAASRGDDPFARACVVVGHSLRGDWLREFRLFERPDAARPVLANLDVVPLHPFVGDWLYAAVERKDPTSRRPSSHPYSKDVLQWRIDAILEREADAFPELERYLRDVPAEVPARRFALAGKIAETFGDYQEHRPEMLVRWEGGAAPRDGTEAWQAELWRRLRRQRAGASLTEQFLAVQRGTANLADAFAHGMPRYRSVHVFGVSSMPRPCLSFFERLSAVVPVFVYAFNPSAEFWFDDETWARARKETIEEDRMKALRRVDEALDRGEPPDVRPLRERLAEKAHPLLGSLATGCQGLLAEMLDRLHGTYDELGAAPSGDTLLARLQRQLFERRDDDERPIPVAADDASVAVHLASTPHREMEILKDGLLAWFADHPGSRPRDALVLCADWEKYAPHVEAVFGADEEGAASLPHTLLGRGAAQDAVVASFLSLLDLSGGRFEADAVLDALAVPAVAARFGLAEDDFPALRDLVREANIRWGLDDDHVAECLRDGGAGATDAPPASGEPFAFTWRRGLDRLLLSSLCGPLDATPEGIAEEGRLGPIRPTGDAESDRAERLGRLTLFLDRLARLHALRRETGTASFWEDRMMGVISDFYETNDDTHRSVSALRDAVATVAARLREADAAAGGAPSEHGFSVIAAAVSDRVKGTDPRPVRTPDAVLFAPLRAGIPSPRRLVWVCGLNDGAFPRSRHRPAFDLLGAHPAPLDPSSRDDDALALLEAVCAARETLVLSHVGTNPATGDDVPPAPLLGALEDYLTDRFARAGSENKRPFALTRHPLQAFSPRYFEQAQPGEAQPPPSFSPSNRDAAMKLAARTAAAGAPDPEPTSFAFLKTDEIDLNDLANAFSNPASAVVRSLAFLTGTDEVPNEDALALDLGKAATVRLGAARTMTEEEAARQGRLLFETGKSASPEQGAAELLAVWNEPSRAHFRDRTFVPKDKNTPAPAAGQDNAVDLIEDAARRPSQPVRATVAVRLADGSQRTVRVIGSIPAAPRTTSDGNEALFAPVLTPGINKPYQMARDWVRHLAANASGLRLETVVLSGSCEPLKKGGHTMSAGAIQNYPPMPKDEAERRLGEVLSLLCDPFPGGIPFHPAASFELARYANPPAPATVRDAFRSAWENSIFPEDRLLWPRSPAALDDARMTQFHRAARLFWAGFPNLKKPVP